MDRSKCLKIDVKSTPILQTRMYNLNRLNSFCLPLSESNVTVECVFSLINVL